MSIHRLVRCYPLKTTQSHYSTKVLNIWFEFSNLLRSGVAKYRMDLGGL